MGLYESWCDATKNKDKRKHYWTYVEKDGGRDRNSRCPHRDDPLTLRPTGTRIAEDVERLGYKVAAKSSARQCPRRKGRSEASW